MSAISLEPVLERDGRADRGRNEEPVMRHSPGFYRRFAMLALRTDLVRSGLCFALMVVLLVADAPFLAALIVPFLVYAGLWRIAPMVSRLFEMKQKPATARSADEAYATCLSLQRKFRLMTERIEDKQASDHLRHITGMIDRILQTVVEDDKYQASVTLVNLIETTDDLLAAYLKVARRGFDGPEVRERVRANLSALESAYTRFWERLNRDAVVDLEALNDTIEFSVVELGTLRQPGAIS
jgi:hypothetical protein